MFGLGNKRAKAVDETELYLKSIFAGLVETSGEAEASRAFADPYVAGFLQVLTTHAVATVYRFRMPDTGTINNIMGEALDRMAFGYGATARKGLAEFGNATHELYEQYLRGRHDGSEHVRTLFTSDGVARNEPHRKFREYVKRHYH